MRAISIFLINLRSSTPLVSMSALKICFKFSSVEIATLSEPSGEGVLFSMVANRERSDEDPSNEVSLLLFIHYHRVLISGYSLASLHMCLTGALYRLLGVFEVITPGSKLYCW